MTRVCLGLLVRDDGVRRVLLGRKKYGFGKGRIVAPGGRLEPGESSVDAVVREVFEETGLRVAPGLTTVVGDLEFVFPYQPVWNLTMTVHMCSDVDGEPMPSDEMDAAWFAVEALPLDEMWNDARHWLGRVLAGERLKALFTFAEDGETVADAHMTTW